MRIGILGPLEVRSADGHLLPVGGARLRSFVIRLAASEGSPVSVDRLAEDLWPHDQPADAANAIQALASRLRGTAGATSSSTARPATGWRSTPTRSTPGRSSGSSRRPRRDGSRPHRRRRRPSSARRCSCGAVRRWPTWPTRRSRPRRSPGCPSCGWPPSRTGSTPTWRSAAVLSSSRRWRSWPPSIRCGSDCAASSCGALRGRPAGGRARRVRGHSPGAGDEPRHRPVAGAGRRAPGHPARRAACRARPWLADGGEAADCGPATAARPGAAAATCPRS